MKEFTLPEYTKCLPDSTKMLSKDLYLVFGYKNCRCFMNAIRKDNYLPQPNGRVISGKIIKNTNKPYFWTLGYLRRIEAEQNAMLQNNQPHIDN